MSCQKCGTQNDAAVRQCVKCGAALKPGKPRTPVVVAYVYAGFWKRFAAFIIDYIVVIIVVMGGAAQRSDLSVVWQMDWRLSARLPARSPGSWRSAFTMC